MLETGSPLPHWESYYVIVGASAAALTGLSFVVIALGSSTRRIGSGETIGAFGTPTVVHFCAVLLVAALLSSPWQTLTPVALGLGAIGVAGLAYSALIVRRARRQTAYAPEFEDWLWHTGLPPIGYGTILVAGILLPAHTHTSLFAVGGAALLLMFIGIHNAWDSATYLALQSARREEGEPGSQPATEPREGED